MDRISQIDNWSGYIVNDFDPALAPASVVIDVGCGEGSQLAGFAAQGHRAFGVDFEPLVSDPVVRSRLILARAEALPFRDGCADAVLIKVVLPYTDDRRTMAEISRVLKHNGRCILVGHGVGYSLRYALQVSEWRRTAYACRTLLNSALFFVSGRRLPGFLGDTITQTNHRLNWLYRRNGLALVSETPSPRFLGLPVFIYHEIRKVAPVPRSSPASSHTAFRVAERHVIPEIRDFVRVCRAIRRYGVSGARKVNEHFSRTI
jgi:SAM-dependent methyltransferase